MKLFLVWTPDASRKIADKFKSSLIQASQENQLCLGNKIKRKKTPQTKLLKDDTKNEPFCFVRKGHMKQLTFFVSPFTSGQEG